MTTMMRTACLIGALMLLAGGKLAAQELIFGSDPLPRATAPSQRLSLAEENKSWEIPVSGDGVTRLVKIAGIGPEKHTSATLACSSSPSMAIANVAWFVAKGDCRLRFKPDADPISTNVTLTVAAATVESSKLSNLPSDHPTFSKAKLDPVSVTLILEGGTPSAANDPSNRRKGRTLLDQLRRPILFVGIIVLLAFIILLVSLKYQLFSFLKYQETRPLKKDAIGGGRADVSLPPLNPSVPTSGQRRGMPLTEQPIPENAVEDTLILHSQRLLDLESKTLSLETRIQEAAQQCTSMLIANGEQADRRLLEIRKDEGRRMHEVESRLAVVQEDLSGHLANQSSRLLDLFKDLPALADLGVPAREIPESELSRLEGQLVSAAKQGALSGMMLDSLRMESKGLLDLIHGFGQAAGNLNKDQTKKRLGRAFEGANVLNNELASLSQLASAQKYGFFVEMSLLEHNPLSKDLASALAREAMKLSDPEGYYRKRLVALKAQSGVAAIDLADLDLDAERRNSGLQEALANLLQRLGMTEIDPQQNDKLQAAEHQVAQFVRRVPGAVPGAVAHTMARGLQRGSEVIRKASVLLYE